LFAISFLRTPSIKFERLLPSVTPMAGLQTAVIEETC
jgi:hypothetical protein